MNVTGRGKFESNSLGTGNKKSKYSKISFEIYIFHMSYICHTLSFNRCFSQLIPHYYGPFYESFEIKIEIKIDFKSQARPKNIFCRFGILEFWKFGDAGLRKTFSCYDWLYSVGT